jgi:XTP/dITP diphosphohydrolase
MKICFATQNHHKIKEVQSLLGEQFQVLTPADLGISEELPEDFDTLHENAMQKARYISDRFDVLSFADDSGLEVDALQGEPGVYSARYAGPEKNNEANMELLLNKLKDKNNRKAQFRTVIALAGFGEHKVFEGVIRGEILHEKRGLKGFGYDPIFVPDGYSLSFAQMEKDQKNDISHRAIAVKKLVSYLKDLRINKDYEL